MHLDECLIFFMMDFNVIFKKLSLTNHILLEAKKACCGTKILHVVNLFSFFFYQQCAVVLEETMVD